MANVAFLFPGQGSQTVGMGKDLAAQYPTAQHILRQFDQWVDPNLQQIMLEGPEEKLMQTRYTQPAILAVSIAAFQVFEESTNLMPRMAAGHSLGEYGALYAAGVIDLETAAKLVKRRAELMDAAPAGAMAAILGLPETQVEKAVLHVRNEGIGIVTVANYNTAEQFVISGEREAVEAACEFAKTLGALKTVMLPVSGAFHSPLMADAAREFETYIKSFRFNEARFPVITNMDAQLTAHAEVFREKLVDQIESPVRWLDTIRLMMQEGVDMFVEFGPGKVLTGMMRKIYKEARLYNVYDAASLQQTVEAVRERAHV